MSSISTQPKHTQVSFLKMVEQIDVLWFWYKILLK